MNTIFQLAPYNHSYNLVNLHGSKDVDTGQLAGFDVPAVTSFLQRYGSRMQTPNSRSRDRLDHRPFSCYNLVPNLSASCRNVQMTSIPPKIPEDATLSCQGKARRGHPKTRRSLLLFHDPSPEQPYVELTRVNLPQTNSLVRQCSTTSI